MEELDPIEKINKDWREYHKRQATMINEAAMRVQRHKDEQLMKNKEMIAKLNEESRIREQIRELDAYRG